MRFELITALVRFVALSTAPSASDSTLFIRVNQVGYRPDAPKVAVACALDGTPISRFKIIDAVGRTALRALRAERAGAFGPCTATFRLDFSSLRTPGRYRVVAAADTSPMFRIGAHVYDGAADTLLYYMREQRSGWNPVFGDSVHRHDGIIVDSPRAGDTVRVSGGWADASDYLQYVTTSDNATYDMLMA
jgi:endoglucanase